MLVRQELQQAFDARSVLFLKPFEDMHDMLLTERPVQTMSETKVGVALTTGSVQYYQGLA